MMTRNLYSTRSCTFLKVLLMALIALGTPGCDGPSAPDVPTVSMADKPMPKIVSATEAIHNPVIPKLDPATLDGAEIDKVLSDGPRCVFRYTAASPPILASTSAGTASNAEGVIKINGRLVKLSLSDPTRGLNWHQAPCSPMKISKWKLSLKPIKTHQRNVLRRCTSISNRTFTQVIKAGIAATILPTSRLHIKNVHFYYLRDGAFNPRDFRF